MPRKMSCIVLEFGYLALVKFWNCFENLFKEFVQTLIIIYFFM